jgi:hypothetical protein
MDKLTFLRGCIQKFPDWPPGARTANGTALCHYLQFYRYIVSPVSFAAITLCVASQRVFIVAVYFVIDSVRKSLDTPSYVSIWLAQRSAADLRSENTGLEIR